MTTSMLLPLVPDMGRRRAAFILESLEDEVRRCGAAFGLLIDRAGQIIAADAPDQETEQTRLHLLAARLVPVFLASRSAACAEQDRFSNGQVVEIDGSAVVLQSILDQWLLAMVFPSDSPPPAAAQLARRWRTRLAQLVPARGATLRVSKAGRTTITRDGVDLLFWRDADDAKHKDEGGA
jgi:hypothetical protein